MLQFTNSTNYISSNIDLSLYYYGIETCQPGYHCDPGFKDHYLIHFILKGKGTCHIGNQCYALEKDSGFLITPNCLSYYKSSLENPLKHCWVGFDGISASSYLKRTDLNQENPIFIYEKTEFVRECFSEMFKAQLIKESKEIKLHSLLYLLLSFLIENSKIKSIPEKSTNTKDSYVKQAIQFVYLNYSRKITIYEMAKYIGLDRKYLATIFHEVLNTSPKEFLIHYRIEKACELLTNPGYTISDTSNAVGYNDPLQFSKAFKKVKGISPKNFRDHFVRR